MLVLMEIVSIAWYFEKSRLNLHFIVFKYVRTVNLIKKRFKGFPVKDFKNNVQFIARELTEIKDHKKDK